MTRKAINRRLAALEGHRGDGASFHLMKPPGWMPAEEYACWYAAEAAAAPPGGGRIVIRFVRPGDVAPGRGRDNRANASRCRESGGAPTTGG